MKLSAVLITLNEERKLPECLRRLDFADEIIVVDSFSRDRTMQLAEQAGAKIVQRAFDSFSGHKNHGIQMACGEWILLVDADELVSPALRDEIREITRSPICCNAYAVRRINQIFGKILCYGASGKDYPVRLIRKGSGLYEGLVHEQLQVRGTVGKLEGELTHITYQTIEEYFSKFNLFTSLDAQEYLRCKCRAPSLFQLLMKPPVEFIFYYFLKLGFLDGWHGFLYQVLSSFYVFVKLSKARMLSKDATLDR